jgi:hypothetical protein
LRLVPGVRGRYGFGWVAAASGTIGPHHGGLTEWPMVAVLKTAGRYPILPRGFESLALRPLVIMPLTSGFVSHWECVDTGWGYPEG